MAARDNEAGAVRLLREIQSGRLPPKSLTTTQRRHCVAHLMVNGYGTAEIVEIFKVNERTIQRDKSEIRKAFSADYGPEGIQELVGSLMMLAENSVNKLSRIARDSNASNKDRIEAHNSAWRTQNEMVARLQSLGFLPTAPTVWHVYLDHRPEGQKRLEQKEEAQRLLAITSKKRGHNDPLAKPLEFLVEALSHENLN